MSDAQSTASVARRSAVIALGPAALSLPGLLAGTFGGLFEGAARAPRQRQRSRQRHGQGPAAPSPSSRHASAHYLVRLQLQHVSPFDRSSLWSCAAIGSISLGAFRHRCSPTSDRPAKRRGRFKQTSFHVSEQPMLGLVPHSCAFASAGYWSFAAFAAGLSSDSAGGEHRCRKAPRGVPRGPHNASRAPAASSPEMIFRFPFRHRSSSIIAFSSPRSRRRSW